MTAFAGIAPWALLLLVVSVLAAVLTIVALALCKKRPGDEVIVHLWPPKVEIRPAGKSEETPKSLDGPADRSD